MTPHQKKRSRELYRLRTECGWTLQRIADHSSISCEFVRLICNREEQFQKWPKFRQRLSSRAQEVLLLRFKQDETIFDDPERIIIETNARELSHYKNAGKVTIAEIVATFVALGYRLRPEWHPIA